ncbi:Hypothetical protein D9617_27g044630 [Elsinoe fawcettii]|nr:Hypothetical protein D9617_27g044630 [Elsinoe fawcettii]
MSLKRRHEEDSRSGFGNAGLSAMHCPPDGISGQDKSLSTSQDASTAATAKLPLIPGGYTVSKRPLMRPAIPSPYSSAQKVVYVSHSTPFMSATKRVMKLLDKADKRATQSALDSVRKGRNDRRGTVRREQDEAGDLDEAARAAAKEEGGEVVVKGTGRAIEKVLGIGLWFQQREGYGVRIKTGSIRAVDDIVEKEDASHIETDDAADLPSARVRWTSTAEVTITRT